MQTLQKLNTSLAGRYAIEREIGAGGMATVYLARDIRHARPVALKVLSPELGAVIGVERFLAEIRVTAYLQHPNLLPLFDSGEVDGLPYYVMPFVDGESLRARLAREKQLPIDEAIRIAVSVAGALEYAHRHGVIHRDLKPENILLQSGQAVVADFGIALALSIAGGARVTQTGLSLGTPQYMSPEQATGERDLDARTDIHSLGAVLYEMLSGEPPYTGATAQVIIAKLLTDRPRRVSLLRATVPAHVEAALDCALAKLPADRFATAREFAEAISGSRVVPPTLGATAEAAPSASRRSSRMTVVLPWAVAALAVVFAVWASRPQQAAPLSQARFRLMLGDASRIHTDVPRTVIGIAPDGSTIAYVGNVEGERRLFVRRLDELQAREIPGSLNARDPRFSPDGKWIGFIRGAVSGNVLCKVAVAGGPPIALLDSVGSYSWGDDDVIVVHRLGPAGGLLRITAAGGTAHPVVRPDSTSRPRVVYHAPHLLPGSRIAIATRQQGQNLESRELVAVHIDDGSIAPLGLRGSNAMYVPTGHLLFSKGDGSIAAVPFDARSLRVTGGEVPVLANVLTKPLPDGAADIAISKNGTLVYLESPIHPQLVLVDRKGRPRPVREQRDEYAFPRFSPDGKRIAMTIERGLASDIWILDLTSSALSRLTSQGKSGFPEWTADGRRIVWTSNPRSAPQGSTQRGDSSAQVWQLFAQPWDGTGAADLLADSLRLADISPTGDFFVAVSRTPDRLADIVMVRRDSPSARRLLASSPAQDWMPDISPDGRWLAYVSNESGQGQVYVQPTNGTGVRRQISVGDGREPRWSRSGREVFYRDRTRMLTATLKFEPELSVARRETLFVDTFLRDAGVLSANYDVASDDQHFIMLSPSLHEEPAIIVFGWFDELREKMKSSVRR